MNFTLRKKFLFMVCLKKIVMEDILKVQNFTFQETKVFVSSFTLPSLMNEPIFKPNLFIHCCVFESTNFFYDINGIYIFESKQSLYCVDIADSFFFYYPNVFCAYCWELIFF